MERSVVLNVSQESIATELREAAFPNHVVFDLESGRMQWNSWRESANEERVLKLS
jgi:hypothetical protein